MAEQHQPYEPMKIDESLLSPDQLKKFNKVRYFKSQNDVISGTLITGAIIFLVFGLPALSLVSTDPTKSLFSPSGAIVLCICLGVGYLFSGKDGASSKERDDSARSLLRQFSYYKKLSDEQAKSGSGSKSSQWERDLGVWIREFGLTTVQNDRTNIRSKDGFSWLEIDFWLPEINLAIEANGCAYHDKQAYLNDIMNDTCHSRERHKEKYCEERAIKLLHVWDDSSEASIKRTIARAIFDKCDTPIMQGLSEERAASINMLPQYKARLHAARILHEYN